VRTESGVGVLEVQGDLDGEDFVFVRDLMMNLLLYSALRFGSGEKTLK
jgi:hypothetical protein